jgi:hypothetical protein
MRPKKEIIIDDNRAYIDSMQRSLILEVLLDIRELLAGAKDGKNEKEEKTNSLS